jgi:hypothetical protein
VAHDSIFHSTKSTNTSSLHKKPVKFVWGRRRHFVVRITSNINIPYGQNAEFHEVKVSAYYTGWRKDAWHCRQHVENKCKVAIATLCIISIMLEGFTVPVVKVHYFALFEFSNNEGAMESSK